MSIERGIPYPLVDLAGLSGMAQSAHVVHEQVWQEMLLDPELSTLMLSTARDLAKRLMGGWACGIFAAESYLLDDPEEPTLIADKANCYVGELADVGLCRVVTDPDIPNFGNVPVSMSLLFEPIEIVGGEGEGTFELDPDDIFRLVTLPESLAVPLLPRFVEIDFSDHLQVCKIRPVS